MNKPKKLASTAAAALAVATLFGTSAFAETRHRDRSGADRQAQVDSRDNDGDSGNNGTSLNRDGRMEQQRADAMRNQRGNDNRGNDNRGYDNRGYDNRGYDNRGSNNNRGYDNRGNGSSRGRGISSEGRVTRIQHDRNGYRVWLDRGNYSYFVPEARWRSWPLRVGIPIRIGGYLDPLGYVYADEIGPYGGGSLYTAGGLRGIVESVDYRRGTMVVRDDLSGSIVTAVLRGGDSRLAYLHRGDYVELSGDWTRGVFEAYRVDDIQNGGYGRY
jgi:hypothetical protein